MDIIGKSSDLLGKKIAELAKKFSGEIVIGYKAELSK